MHRPGVIDLGRGSGIGIRLRREPGRPEIPWIQVVVQLVDGIIVGGVCVSVPPDLVEARMKKEIDSCCATGKTPVHENIQSRCRVFRGCRCGAYVLFSYVLIARADRETASI